MELNKLYEIAENENIKVYDWHIEDCQGIYLNYDKINAIALNYDEIGTYVEEKCTLAEELGHYFTEATYTFYSDTETINKQEYKAKKWSYNVLVPLPKLKKYLSLGINKIYELADIFEVSAEFMQNCLKYYNDRGLLSI